MRWDEATICKQAAVFGFTAAYCFAPLPQDEAPKGCKTLILLVRAYRPGGRLVDAFYPASNAAYHQAKAFAELLAQDMQVWPLSNLRLKPICTRQPQFGRGMNTLNYLPDIGSRFCLEMIGMSEIIETNIKITDQSSKNSDWNLRCLSCQRCLHACPTGAITPQGFVRENCLRNYMLSGKPVPEHMRAYYGVQGGAMGVIGCDICQRVCPYNALPERQRCDEEAFSLPALLHCDANALSQFAALYGRNYAIRNRILAQALLAAGNSADASLLADIAPLKESASDAVAQHAAWAETKLKNLAKKY